MAGKQSNVVTLKDLDEARENLPIWPFWKMLIRFIRQRDQVKVTGAGGKVRRKVTLDGVELIVEQQTTWRGRFRVTASSTEVRVGSGFINDRVPSIDGIFLDGLDDEGKRGELPVLKIKAPGEGVVLTHVCVTIRVNESGVPLGAGEEGAGDDPLTIEHIEDLDAERIKRPGAGFQTLAKLYWSKKRVLRVRQVVLHDLVHSYEIAEGLAPGRNFFSGV